MSDKKNKPLTKEQKQARKERKEARRELRALKANQRCDHDWAPMGSEGGQFCMSCMETKW